MLDPLTSSQKRPNTLRTGKKGSNTASATTLEEATASTGSTGRSKSTLRISEKRQTLEPPIQNSQIEEINHSLSVIAENENERTVVLSSSKKLVSSV